MLCVGVFSGSLFRNVPSDDKIISVVFQLDLASALGPNEFSIIICFFKIVRISLFKMFLLQLSFSFILGLFLSGLIPIL